MGDEIAGLDTGAVGRGVVNRRDHLDEAVLHGDLDAQAAELALGLDPHITEGIGVQIAGMGVEGREHALNGIFDQLFVGHVFDVIGAHAFKDIAEKLQLAVGFRAVFLSGGYQRKDNQKGGRQAGDQEFAH